MRAAFFIFSFFLLIDQSRAQSSLSADAANFSEGQKKLTTTVVIDTSTTLAPGAAGSAGEGYSQSGYYRVDLGYRLKDSLKATARVSYSQEYSYVLDDGSAGGFLDTWFGLSKSWGQVAKDLNLSSSINLTLPTSKDSQRARMFSAVGIGVTAAYKWKQFDFTLAPRLTQLFHEVEVQDDGKLNMERSLSVTVDAGYNISDKLRFGVTFWPSHSWTYRGTSRDKYILAYDLGYSINEKFSVSGGLFTNASALKSNGLDYNYTLFDQGQTTGYIDLIVNI